MLVLFRSFFFGGGTTIPHDDDPKKIWMLKHNNAGVQKKGRNGYGVCVGAIVSAPLSPLYVYTFEYKESNPFHPI